MLRSHNAELRIQTQGKGTYEITDQIREIVRESRVQDGVATVFIRHTSASLILFENADPTARVDLKEYFERLAPEEKEYFTHTLEGPDDMPSHLRMVLTRSSETIPISRGELQLGTWQGIFIFEHRRCPRTRSIAINVMGEAG
jgi:secondary thiamine-phosphate synthase enzyme